MSEFDLGNHGKLFYDAERDFLNSQREKKGLPPVDPAMGFVDSPEFSGQLPIDEIEADD